MDKYGQRNREVPPLRIDTALAGDTHSLARRTDPLQLVQSELDYPRFLRPKFSTPKYRG